jgi:hypothetical protein
VGISAASVAQFSYVVVEELVDVRVVLMAWPWPEADDQGRLFWTLAADSSPKNAVVSRDLLRQQLYRPSRLLRRPRLGDVYAASRLGPGWEDRRPITDVRRLFDGPAYDISADAREAAKLAYQGPAAPFIQTIKAEDPLDSRLLDQAAVRRRRLAAKPLKLYQPSTPLH